MKRKIKYRMYMFLLSSTIFAFFFTITAIHPPSKIEQTTVQKATL